MNTILIFTFVLGLTSFVYGADSEKVISDGTLRQRICSKCSPPICGQRFNGTLMPGTQTLFANVCEFNRINSLSKPGYVRVPASECKKTIIIDDTPCAQVCSASSPPVCGQLSNGTLIAGTERSFPNICEFNNLNCRIKPGYVEVPASQC